MESSRSIVIGGVACLVAGALVGLYFGQRRGRQRTRIGVLDCVGETSLIELKSLSDALGRLVFVKLEMLNVGGTSKDRAAKKMLIDARLKPGQTVYEVLLVCSCVVAV
jgi:hypothetical protein